MVRNFYVRHRSELRFAVLRLQESKRFTIVNSATLAEQYAAIETVQKKYHLDDEGSGA